MFMLNESNMSQTNENNILLATERREILSSSFFYYFISADFMWSLGTLSDGKIFDDDYAL
jgi:hypothetical protein